MGQQRQLRRQLSTRYAGLDQDLEAPVVARRDEIEPLVPQVAARPTQPAISMPGFPFSAHEARRRQQELGAAHRTVDLGGGVTMQLVRIPAGEFVMGDPGEREDETPRRVRIDQPFWIGACEVTNAQLARFEPEHDSRYIRTHGITSNRGYPVNLPQQPAVRVSWLEATAFCRLGYAAWRKVYDVGFRVVWLDTAGQDSARESSPAR